MVKRVFSLLLLLALLLPPGATRAASSPPPIDGCVTLPAVLYTDGVTWIPDHEHAGLESHEYDFFSGLPLLSYDFFNFRIGNAGHAVSIGHYSDIGRQTIHSLPADQQVTVSVHTRDLSIWSYVDFGSIELCSPSETGLGVSEVVDVAMYLTTEQVDAWKVGSDTFPIFTGLAFFVTVFGVLSIIVAMMRLRWASDDDD
jgi:hypothetical protein